jgi:CheY-like chemotaxis protein
VRRILFVEDERNVLEGFQRMLRSWRHEGAQVRKALSMLEAPSFDAIVSGMRIPEMDIRCGSVELKCATLATPG